MSFIDRFGERGNRDAKFLEDGNDDPFILPDERAQEMRIVHERISIAARQ